MMPFQNMVICHNIFSILPKALVNEMHLPDLILKELHSWNYLKLKMYP